MNQLHLECEWLDAGQVLNLAELSRICGMSSAELDELVEYGALSPLKADQPEPQFPAQYIPRLRTAGKLRRDYDLELFAVAIVLDYLDRIETLEAQLRALQAGNASSGSSKPAQGG
ncbi:MAG: chaperone modulator CbpM [Hylemonella sp.]|nr:chaperone modulator CbpM [Hylemonella sp.]